MSEWLPKGDAHSNSVCLVAEEIDPLASSSHRLLLWLLQYPFQSIEDIVLALRWHHASIYRGIKKLEKQGLVEAIHDPLSATKACALYLLSYKGIMTIADVLGVDANGLMAKWHYRERDILERLPRIHTQRILQQVINNFVVRWEHGNNSGARITWKWIPDYRQTSISIVKRQTSLADALIIFSKHSQASSPSKLSQTVYQSFLLVIDPGFAGERDRDLIQWRVESLYLFYYAQGQLHPDRKDPPIFIVTPSKCNSAIWTQILHEIVGRQSPKFFSGAIMTCTSEESLLAHYDLKWEQMSTDCYYSSIKIFSLSTYWEPPYAGLSQHPIDRLSSTDVKSILRGHFMQRSRRNIGLECLDRETIGLLGLRLHRRHLDVLRMLYQHPLLCREEIAERLHIENNSVQYTLRDIMRWRYVNIYHLSCGQHFSLGRSGIRFIAGLLQVAPTVITEIYQGHDQRILQHGKHVQRGLIVQIKKLLKANVSLL